MTDMLWTCFRSAAWGGQASSPCTVRHNPFPCLKQAVGRPMHVCTAPLCKFQYFARMYLRLTSPCAASICTCTGQPGVADVILLAYALAVWRGLDNTAQGFAMSLLTAVAGPAVEVFLINMLGLYHYEHPLVRHGQTATQSVKLLDARTSGKETADESSRCGQSLLGVLHRCLWRVHQASWSACWVPLTCLPLTGAQVLGVPTWIPWVYFCGGPAVGLLGRKVWATLKAQGRAAP